MPNKALIQEGKKIPLALTLVRVASIWIISDLAYYIALPALGLNPSYNAEPVGIALYYLLWVIVALITFSHLFENWRPISNGSFTYVMLALISLLVLFFLAYVLPQFPPIHWSEPWRPPSELLFATHWYFLPKSIEILLQQLLVAALVLSFASHGIGMRSTILWCVLLFGGGHLLLVFGGSPIGYVARFTGAAIVAGAVFPYLLLRVQNGFAYAYFLHWMYYASTIVLIHTISPYA